MCRLRSKIVVTLFFCLISMGQAYPFAVAYAHGMAAQCSCSRAGRNCVHGCDVKKRSQHKKHHHAGHQHVQKSTSHAAHVSHNHEPSQQPATFVSPTCAQQHQQKVLGFQSDPFIPARGGSFFANLRKQAMVQFQKPFQEWILACDAPPPKEEEPPADSV